MTNETVTQHEAPEHPPDKGKRQHMLCKNCGRNFWGFPELGNVCGFCHKPKNPPVESAEMAMDPASGVSKSVTTIVKGSKPPENPPVESAEATAREMDGVPAVAPCEACTDSQLGPIPGILANGERCDACERFASDGDAKMIVDLLEALQAALGTFDYKAKQKWPKVHAAGLAAIAQTIGVEVTS